MATITTIPQFSAPVWVAIKRLTHHAESGRMLSGLKWFKEGGVRVEGTKHMPSLQPIRVTMESAVFAGAPREENKGLDRSNTPLSNTFVLTLGLAVDVRHGFIQMDPDDPSTKPGLLEWVGLIQDAVETNEAGEVDARLENSLSKPVAFMLREPDPGELSFAAMVDVILASRGHCRGERAWTFPQL